MPQKDILSALLVVVAWGINFVIMKIGLHGVPPMLLGALRFLLAASPVLFIKRPQVPWRWLVAYGLTISFGQFAFLFSALYAGMPAGLASLVLQAQAFFTLIFAGVALGERLRTQNFLGLVIAAAGLAVIGLQAGVAITVTGFALTLCAAVCWATGNIVTKKIGPTDLVGLVVWGSLIPPLPFLLMSYWLEGPQRIADALIGIDARSVFAVIYLAFISTIIGYGLWGRLMSRYPASQVAPFSLLVPVVGLASASLFLGERLSSVQLAGTVLVMAGLAINVFGSRMVRGLASLRP
jgi:O-acetylserine/cysteine efflux transporter